MSRFFSARDFVLRGTLLASFAYFTKWLWQYWYTPRLMINPVSMPPTSDKSLLTTRVAVEEDLAYVESLSGAAGANIVPGGGDFVVQESSS